MNLKKYYFNYHSIETFLQYGLQNFYTEFFNLRFLPICEPLIHSTGTFQWQELFLLRW
jgi:hypothetical protein